jgi:hypothetical protein
VCLIINSFDFFFVFKLCTIVLQYGLVFCCCFTDSLCFNTQFHSEFIFVVVMELEVGVIGYSFDPHFPGNG